MTEVPLPIFLKAIRRNCFNRCLSLETVTIPASVENLDRFAFCSCTHFQQVTFLDRQTTIAGDAFLHGPCLTFCAPAGSAAEQYARSGFRDLSACRSSKKSCRVSTTAPGRENGFCALTPPPGWLSGRRQ